MKWSRSWIGRASILALLGITWTTPALGQNALATIRGRVTDEQGAVLPGVTLTITQTETNSSRTAVSQELGQYFVPNLPAGTYVVAAMLQGFAPQRRQNITLRVGQELTTHNTGSRLMRFDSRCISVLLAVAGIACSKQDVTIHFYSADGYEFSQSERRAIQAVAEATATEVRSRLLPALPRELVLRVQPGKSVIPETGETGYAVLPNSVGWMVDPSHAGGVTATIQNELRATLFHEFHHLVRYAKIGNSQSLMDEVVTEGMATVFERDAAGASPPWGKYPDDVMNWVNELRALPPDADRNYWLTKRHADGRRWIGMRAGAYLVDRATRASGESSAQLVSAPADSVIRLALQR